MMFFPGDCRSGSTGLLSLFCCKVEAAPEIIVQGMENFFNRKKAQALLLDRSGCGRAGADLRAAEKL